MTLADGPNLVILGPDGGPGAEPVWGRRGWLFGPRLVLTPADLERWFAGDRDPQRGEGGDSPSSVTASCWRTGIEPLTIFHVPQRAWLMSCSLVFLTIVLFLFLIARRSKEGQTTVDGWFLGPPPCAAARRRHDRRVSSASGVGRDYLRLSSGRARAASSRHRPSRLARAAAATNRFPAELSARRRGTHARRYFRSPRGTVHGRRAPCARRRLAHGRSTPSRRLSRLDRNEGEQ